MSTKTAEQELTHGVEVFSKYKNLLFELTRKNVKLKYRNSWLGIFWSFLQPLLNMTVLSVVFAGIFGRHSEYIVCYPVFLFTGRLLYDFFNTSTKQAMTSFRRNAAIIKKVYVPKYMYPLSSIFSTFVTFAISLLCLIVVWIFFKVTGVSGGHDLEITWRALLCIVPMLLILVFSTGVGLILSVMAVYFRDIEYIWDVLTRLLMYMVPILYPLQRIETRWIIIVIKINPLYSMIELFRQCVLYGFPMSWKLLAYAAGVSFLTLAIGMFIFDRKSDDLIYHL
ncbi:MAG: ABC transporter permease [Ruminococcaceae bacterium]|nr:ABC transporter permease [Oscillospiraceae bacterium]